MIVYINLGKKYFHLEGVLPTVGKVLGAVAIMTAYLFICSRLTANGWIVLIVQVCGAMAIYLLTLLLMKEDVVRQYSSLVVGRLTRMAKK